MVCGGGGRKREWCWLLVLRRRGVLKLQETFEMRQRPIILPLRLTQGRKRQWRAL